ncbi:MAG: hypothetical protein KBT32_01900 [Bacteroidales bacterium]|nr:hypothetical protein [Candidatus Physcocola equi]
MRKLFLSVATAVSLMFTASAITVMNVEEKDGTVTKYDVESVNEITFGEADKIDTPVNPLQEALEAAQNKAAEAQKEAEEAKQKLDEAEDAILEAMLKVKGAEKVAEAAQTELAAAKKELENVQAEASAAKNDLEAAQKKVADAEKTAEAAQAANASAQKELEAAQATINTAKKELEAAQKEVYTTKKELEAAQAATATAKKDLETAQAEAATAKKELETAQAEAAAAKKDLETAQAEAAATKKDLEAAQAATATAKKDLEAAQAATAAAKKDLEEANKRIAELEDFTATLDLLKYGEFEHVDLGLTSGNVWATSNLGVEDQYAYGDYYAWGELEPKNDVSMFSRLNYRFYDADASEYTKYCEYDNKTTLQMSDDPIRIEMQGSWRMPSEDDFQELIDECTWKWVNDGEHVGALATGPNGNTIFFPAGGHLAPGVGTNLYIGAFGYYWTKNLAYGSEHSASIMRIGADVVNNGKKRPRIQSDERFHGVNIRAVCPR